jgi:uncharacterized phage protein gp47/JayE
MYEDKTVDNILKDMLAQFGADVRTDEGSLAWNACAKIADALETYYEELESVRLNITPDTMDLEHLILFAPQVGLSYREATPAIARGVFSQEIETGKQFYCGDYTYTCTGPIPETVYNYYMTCDQEGAEANTNTGTLVPIDYIDEYEGGSITEVLTLGVDDEDEEVFRARILDSFGAKAFGGNKADYQEFINGLDDVGACKPKRRTSDSPWINIWILDSVLGVPAASVVTAVQDAVDPTVSSGEGDGMAPICHHVQIIAATGVTINVGATITLDTGYTIVAVKDSIKAAISEYLYELRQSWESNALTSMVVRIAQIEARILSVEGVLDVANTTINSSASNLTLTYEKVPIIGEVTLNV